MHSRARRIQEEESDSSSDEADQHATDRLQPPAPFTTSPRQALEALLPTATRASAPSRSPIKAISELDLKLLVFS
jgi:hypothetical protein